MEDIVSIDELKNSTIDQILDYCNKMEEMKAAHDPSDKKGIEEFNKQIVNAKLAFAQKTILYAD